MEWTFDTTRTSTDGINDASITYFKGKTISGLVREAIQNSIDAKDTAKKEPVKVQLRVIEMHPSEIPGFLQLKQICEYGKEYYKKSNDPEGIKFYERALSRLKNGKNIPIFKISDFNTTGLTGSSREIGSNFYNCLIAEGDNNKGKGAGGAFGIGRGALYGASGIRFLIYSTKCEKEGIAFQGKIRISSFYDKQVGSLMRGKGTFGDKEGLEIRSIGSVPEKFRRNENGLDIYIIDFIEPDEWEEKTVRRVLNDFWLSIAENVLEVDISDGKYKINSGNVGDLIKNTFSVELRDSGAYDSKDESPLPAFCAYAEGEKYKKSLVTLGECSLYLTHDPRFAPKISHFRKPKMLIYKVPYGISNIQGCFICENEKGNEILRASENPEHKKWSSVNVGQNSEIGKEEVRKALKEVKDFILEGINKQFNSEGETLRDFNFNGLSFFSGETEESNEINKAGSDQNPETGIITYPEEPHPISSQTPKVKIPILTFGRKRGKGNPWKGSADPGKPVVENGQKRRYIEAESRSFVYQNGKGENVHRIIVKDLKPRKDIVFKLYGKTEEGKIPLEIAHVITEGAKVEDNKLFFEKTGTVTKLDVVFKDKGRYGIDVEGLERIKE